MEVPATTETLARRVSDSLALLCGELMKSNMETMLRLLQREDLSMPRMVTLFFLQRHGGSSISHISEHLNLSLAATSQLVEKLVEGGFVMRVEDPDDRRQKHVTLTAKGQALNAEVQRIRSEELARRMADVPQALLLAVAADLDAVLGYLNQAAANSST